MINTLNHRRLLKILFFLFVLMLFNMMKFKPSDITYRKDNNSKQVFQEASIVGNIHVINL
ncbi:MAG TPA: hypothetical protein VIK89_01930 [Cytophagaceae bacterium]